MRVPWQKINGCCLFCHSWQDPDRCRITAMTFLVILLAVAVALSIQSLRVALHDGNGSQRPPQSHFEDPMFRSPAARH